MTYYENLFKAMPMPGTGQRRIDLVDPAGLRRGLHRVLGWYRRNAQRRRLGELDAHLLRDIGLTREQATFEADKPFWMD